MFMKTLGKILVCPRDTILSFIMSLQIQITVCGLHNTQPCVIIELRYAAKKGNEYCNSLFRETKFVTVG